MKCLQASSKPSMYLSALALLVGLAVVPTAGAEIVERVLVRVNGEIFTKSDLEARQVQVLRRQNPPVKEADLQKQVEAITPQILVDTIDEMLLLQRGKELGYRMTEEQFQDILGRLKSENKIETDAQFQAALKQEGLTLADLRKSIERQMIIERVEQSEVFGHIGVSEAEARKYYDEHKNEFTSVPTVTLREILVKVPTDPKGLNVAADEEAKQKAEAIRERALKGESFDKLATELSEAPSKANAGLIGPISRADLDPDFAKLLGGMKPGDISAPIRTASGYDVVKLESATETALLPYEEARQQIANKVYGSKQRAEFETYITKLRASAIIDWKVPELKKLYEDQIARSRSSAVGGLAQ